MSLVQIRWKAVIINSVGTSEYPFVIVKDKLFLVNFLALTRYPCYSFFGLISDELHKIKEKK
jgi:hypothetical protein